MSSRTSSSSGEGLPSSRRGERTPLRRLENEMLHLSTPSRFKSKSLFNAGAVETTKGDTTLCDPEPHLQSPPVMQTNAATVGMTISEAACGLGDVTFKSIICPGGEVEITGSSLCTDESIILPKDQAMKNTCDIEDSVINHSMIVQSCSDHMEHPYYNPETKDASLADIDTACLCDISNITLVSGDLDDKRNTQDFRVLQNDCCGKKDVTWKSFVCDGGEVDVCDVTRLQDETIPVPKVQLNEPSQDCGLNSTNLSDSVQVCQVEHADHAYCSSESGVCVITSSETTRGSENPAIGLRDVTFTTFDCIGEEIEIPDGTKLADEAVPVQADQTGTCSESYNCSIDPSMFHSDQDVQNGDVHLDHPCCNVEDNPSTRSVNLFVTQEPLPFSFDAVDEVKQISLVVPDSETGRREGITFSSFINARSEVEKSDVTRLFQKTSPLPDDQAVTYQPVDDTSVPTSVTLDHIHDNYEQPNSHVEKTKVVVDTDPPAISTSSLPNISVKSVDNKSVNCQMQESSKKDSTHPEDSALRSLFHRTESSDISHILASAETPTPVEVHLEHVSCSGSCESSEAKVCNAAEHLPDYLKVLSECPSVASALQFGNLSPVVRRDSVFVLKNHEDLAVDQFLTENSALKSEKSSVAPVNGDPPGFWAEHLESPMPRPLFNSTALGCKPQPGAVTEPVEDAGVKPCAVPQSEVRKPVLGIPLIPDGPLQQQLRQMAEFLFLASGKMNPAAVSTPSLPPAAVTVPSARATPAESHSVGVGTTHIQFADHSVNTSGQFERERNFSVVDSSTLTDPLLWNVPPGSLECLPRQELEQRLTCSMIMVEALVQQLTSARTHGCPPAGPAPSDLREKLVQTDHTELSQTTMHRDLYLEALNRIGELELNRSSLQNLIQCMQDMRLTMTSLSCDTDSALSHMKQMGDVVREDHQSLVSHYCQMTSVFERTKETQTVMMQKVKETFHQRDDLKVQMEEAFTAKEAAFSVMEQLRKHCATEVSELERIVGSQQELLAALHQTYPEQVALNQACSEMLNSASDVLSTTLKEQSSLMKKLFTVRGLLQKTAPVLLKLNEKADAALRERDEHIAARNQAVEEREQIEEEWNQANLNLQTARKQISDLNLQVTILTSEMGVLRQKLTEREEEKGQLERKVTELSATVSSTLASYTFLEQALASESTKLQQSWKDIQLTKDRANELEMSLGQSEQRVCELSQALAQSEAQLSQLQALSHSQNMQIQQLQDVCTQLRGVQEMNEFLQMENELAREQVAESETMLRVNLQGLRERNIQFEDLKGELGQLQFESRSLQEELETTRSRASAAQLELGEKLGQAVTEITLLHHTLRGLTNDVQAALNNQKSEPQKDEEPQPVHNMERCLSSTSFVDSIIVALTAEKEEDVKAETPFGPVPSDVPEPQDETLFSETSAFTRIEAVTPKKNWSAGEFDPAEDEQNNVPELFADLGSTVAELISTLELLRQHRDAQLEELHDTIRGLQGEQQAATSRHEAEVLQLKHQLSHLTSLIESGNHALQQKAQDDKTLTKLTSEIQKTQEIMNAYKTDRNELRKEVVELRCSLQQSKVESQFLRGELRKAGGRSANPAHYMEEKIQLLKEVERLKLSLQEVEQARVKLLDRAKRHQIIHQTNKEKCENELQVLNNMINKVRETLLSLPEVVKNCDPLLHLVEYIG